MNAKIQELYNTLTTYSNVVSNWTLRSIDMWDTATPKDVTIKTVDANGNLVDKVVPNIAKILDNYELSNPSTAGAMASHDINVSSVQEFIDAVESLQNYSLLGTVNIILAGGVYNFASSIDLFNIGRGDAILRIEPAPAAVVRMSMTTAGDIPLFNIKDSAVSLGAFRITGVRGANGVGGTEGLAISNSDVTFDNTELFILGKGFVATNKSIIRSTSLDVQYTNLGVDAQSGSIVDVSGINIAGDSSDKADKADGIRSDGATVKANNSTIRYVGKGIVGLNGSKVEAKSATILSRDMGFVLVDNSVGDITSTVLTGQERVNGILAGYGIFLNKNSTLKTDNTTADQYAFAVSSMNGSLITGTGVTVSNVTYKGLYAYNSSIALLNSFLTFPANVNAALADKRLVQSLAGSAINIDNLAITNEVGLKIEASANSIIEGGTITNTNSVRLEVYGKSLLLLIGIGTNTSNIALNTDTPDGGITTVGAYGSTYLLPTVI